jgi:hypothetical protein
MLYPRTTARQRLNVRLGSWLCENAKTLNRDRRSYSSKTALGLQFASAFNLEIKLEDVILVAFRLFAFSHSQGQKQKWLGPNDLSALPSSTDMRRLRGMSQKCHQRTHALRQKAPCGITSSARAHHRVERTDRDARREVRSMRSRATSSTKPPPTAAPRERARRQSAGMWRRLAEKRVVFTVTLPGITAAFVLRRVGTQAAVELPMVLPIRILQLSPAAQQLIDNN